MTTGEVPKAVRVRVRVQAGNRCGYCRAHQDHLLWTLEIEHIIPRGKGGTHNEENLWLACHACNLYKGTQAQARDPLTGHQVRLFNPRYEKWLDHFQWSQDGVLILGRTACGRATVIALKLNNLTSVTVRRNWVRAGWHPPIDED